ncbi:hypothetical protein BP6252_10078 [Coleophoma cylindrospora]|uniref:Heterokaryon incompatibility domain-containing protein n=1 Tax=Coleophoma cylindrospora TaxID=1849047 RepID=A0A3D8QX84_9HELO|nr:hypothetical protein BP6252_10078 [Coleophoma cylindrospora]
MLCPLCAEVDLDQLTSPEGIHHYANFQDLAQSAAAGYDPLAPFIPHRPIDGNPGSDACFNLAQQWLQNCLHAHGDCSSNKNEEQRLPTRVIDVGLMDDSIPRLFVTCGAKGNWFTLSHCWGKIQPLRTTSSTLRAHQEALPLGQLPELFKDAIKITRHFKQRYLWIDSLCIIQDAAEDWLIESANMGYIYKNSLLTIACETAADSTQSILDPAFTDRHLFSPRVRVPYYNSQGTTGHLLLRKNIRIADMAPGPLARRAWTLQEDVLSPRVLRWTKQRLRWQCRTTDCTEELPHGVPKNNRDLNHGRFICLPPALLKRRNSEMENGVPESSPMVMDVPTLWYQMVNNFASRSLTYDTDRFLAISGLAREVEKHTRNDYRAGLWLQEMHRGLLWYVSPPGVRSETYIAPSWSWASVNTMANPTRNVWSLFHPHLKPYKGQGNLVPISTVIDVAVQNVNKDIFAQVTSAALTLLGPVFKASPEDQHRFVQARQPQVTGDKIFEHQDVKAGTLLVVFDLVSASVQDLFRDQTGITLVQIAEMAGNARENFRGMVYGLLLCRRDGMSEGYTRIGMVRMAEDFAKGEGWEKERTMIF